MRTTALTRGPSTRGATQEEALNSMAIGTWTNDRTPVDSSRPLRWTIERPALLERLESLGPGETAFLSAPAGFGKSTVVRQWTSSASLPSTWLSATECKDEAEFRTALFRALRHLRPEDGRSADGPPDWSDVLTGQRPAILVIDGVRAETTLATLTELAWAAAHADDCRLRIVITSRRRPPAAFVRLAVERRAIVLAEVDLAFNERESRSVIAAVSGREIPATVLDQVLHRLEGWPAATVAIASAWQHGTDLDRATGVGIELAETFVLDETLAGVDDETLGLLSDIARLEEVNGDLCDAATGRVGTAATLDRFREMGGPLAAGQRTGNDPFVQPWVHLHPLLRTTIVARVPERSPGRRLAVASAGAAWLRERGDVLAAARVYGAMGQWDDVEQLILTNIGNLLASGRAGAVADVLASAPAEVMARQGHWIAGHALLETYSGRPGRALELLAVGERWLKPTSAMAADLIRASTGVASADPGPALSWAEDAMAKCDSLGEDAQFYDSYNKSRTEHYRVIGRGHLVCLGALAGHWSRVSRHRNDPDPMVLAEMPTGTAARALGHHALHCVLSGDLRNAESLIATAEGSAIEGDVFVAWNRLPLRIAEAELARLRGRAGEAIPLLEDARSTAADNGQILYQAMAGASLASAMLDQGDVAGAERAVHDLESLPSVQARTIVGMVIAARVRIAFARGGHAAAMAQIRGVLPSTIAAAAVADVALRSHDKPFLRALLDHWPNEPTTAGRVQRGLVASALQLADGRRDEAERLLDPALTHAARHELTQPVAGLADHLVPLLQAAAASRRHRVSAFCRSVLPAVTRATMQPRHEAILRLMADGHTLQAIADELHLSVNTVKKNAGAIYRALGARNRAEALATWASIRSLPREGP